MNTVTKVERENFLSDQAFVLVVSFWLWRRVYIEMLIPKFGSHADIYAAEILGLQHYREGLRQMANSKWA